MIMNKYDRRELFKVFGASALFLHPLLSIRDEAFAEELVKRRMVYFHTSSGVVQKHWWPSFKGSTFDLTGTNLEVLKPYQSDLTFVRGIRGYHGGLDAHSGGMVNLMTGRKSNLTNCSGSCDVPSGDLYARGISVDQFVAEKLKGQTNRKSLVFSVVPTKVRPSGFLSYNENGTYVPQLKDPFAAFDDIFRDLVASCDPNKAEDNAKQMALRAKKKSILDAITADLKDAVRLNGLSASEKAKLESYTETVRELEASLNAMVADNEAACKTLDPFFNGPRFKVDATNYIKVARLMMDLIVAAFQLDLTRVATLIWSVGGNDGVPSTFAQYGGKPIQMSYHALTHQPRSQAEETVSAIDKVHAGEYFYLLKKLKTATENGTPLLDKSMVIWQSEISDGFSHSSGNIPFVIAGKAGGNIKGGQMIDMGPGITDINAMKHPSQTLNLAAIHAMGFTDVTSFGSDEWTEGRDIKTPIKLK